MTFSHKDITTINKEADRITNTYMRPLAVLKYFFMRTPTLSGILIFISTVLYINLIYLLAIGSSPLAEELTSVGIFGPWLRAGAIILSSVLMFLNVRMVLRTTRLNMLKEVEKELEPKLKQSISALVYCRITFKNNKLVASYDLTKKKSEEE